jgi:hypothetical protein
MIFFPSRPVVFGLFMALSAPLLAAKTYKIEVIVFAQNDQSVLYDELFPLEIDWQIPPTDQQLMPQILTPDELRLAPEAARLTRSSAYRVITHQAWLAPEVSKKEAQWVHLSVAVDPVTPLIEWINPALPPLEDQTLPDQPPPTSLMPAQPVLNLDLKSEMLALTSPEATVQTEGEAVVEDARIPAEFTEGYIRFYKERFHHAELKIKMRLPVTQDYAQYRLNLEKALINPELTADKFLAQEFVLQASKRLKSDTLFYFDHPVFGVLLRIEPAA